MVSFKKSTALAIGSAAIVAGCRDLKGNEEEQNQLVEDPFAPRRLGEANNENIRRELKSWKIF